MSQTNIGSVDLNLFKVFEALYEEGGASRAGIRLDMTQSAVSAALRRLREVFDDPLFVRTGRGLAPTGRAQELKPVIGEALDQCRRSLAIAAPDATSFEGRSVSVGLSDDFEIAVGRALIERVALAAPGLRIIFRQTHSQIAADALADREMDLAVTAGPLSSRGLRQRSLGEGGYACLIDRGEGVGAAAGKRRSHAALTLDDYLAREHILVSSGGVVGIVDEGLAALGRTRRIVASTTHFASVPHLLKGSRAVVTIPAHAAAAIARLTDLTLLPCPVALPGYPVSLGWRHSAMRDVAVTKVWEAIVACFEGGGVLGGGAAR
ncbi:LysR family transcriptional regulator [Burkholderia sp. Ac-20379]|uniref:LysR family transcriptional regulator n=1 Tax=Burkholderia sp. Ac-20379 TaxID=2703900 RepID=UPI00197DCE1D|nr:LysR family transcriptional regulator [Burkholderia sp. Ac-20379]MBN3724757.1 LysR family transcriptional regulator [Burkholderia sp. Ac-20379]